MADKPDLVKINLDSLLLSIINEKSAYGYQIIKDLEGRSQGYFRFKEGTLYPALHRLERSGLVEGKWQALANGQKRKYYNITEKGMATLRVKRNSWNEFRNAMNLVIQIEPGS